MGEMSYLLAAVLAKMFDPLILAAGVAPALVAPRVVTLIVAVGIGAALGIFVYVMSAERGHAVSATVILTCALASALWWAIAYTLRRLIVLRGK